MSFEFLFRPVEALDAWLVSLLAGAPLLVTLGLALALGLRHASDPDHLVAVTSLVAADGGGSRSAARLGAWWGLGHAACLLGVGLPLIALKADLPGWLQAGAEKAVGLAIVLLAARVTWKWMLGGYRSGAHRHAASAEVPAGTAHRHLHRDEGYEHGHTRVRTPRQAFAIGLIHGFAGTGAVVLILVATLPSQLEAAAALAVFAPMTLVSMAAVTSALAWLFTRRVVEPLYRAVLIPALGLFGLMFGLWYSGLA